VISRSFIFVVVVVIIWYSNSDNMQNTTLFQLVLCVVQACSGLDSLVFAYVMLVVWLCFRYTTIEASMRRNGKIRREKRRNKQVLKFQLQGDGRHTL